MKKLIRNSLLVVAFIVFWKLQAGEAGEGTSKSYKMVVVIPEIVGANVPYPSSTTLGTSASTQLAKNFNTNAPIIEERFVNNRKVVYESIVTK